MAVYDANAMSNLNSFFKIKYADKMETLIPDGVKLLKLIPFVKDQDKLGQMYVQPVVLQQEHGFTYSNSGDAFALNDSISGSIKDAQLRGTEIMLRSTISNSAISRSLADKSGAAFERVTKYVVANMTQSFGKRLECILMYGTKGLGVIDSVSVGPATSVIITAKTWAAGIWAAGEGAAIDFVSGGVVVETRTIASVDFDLRKITFTAAITTAVAGDDLFFKGSFGNEFMGIDAIIRNTGVYANINATSYNLWKGNVLGNAGTPRNLTMSLLNQAVSRATEKGLVDQDVVVLVSPQGWDQLLSEQTALRMFDSSYKSAELENGGEALTFFSQNGKIKVIPSIYCKRGSAYVLPIDGLMRIGSSDVTFNHLGFEGQFFRPLEANSGYELRAYCDQALFALAPGKMSVIEDLA